MSSTPVVAATGHARSTPGGPPSTSSTLVVAAAEHAASTPQGGRIDVFNFSGGRCRTCRQAPPREPAIDVWVTWYFPQENYLAASTRGATTVNITTTSKAASWKSEGKSFGKIIFRTLRCQEPEIHITTTEVQVKINKLRYDINC
jgi:hypothetical protein